MRRCHALPACAILALLLPGLAAAPARAAHAVIALKAVASDGQQESTADQEPPAGGVNPRPKLDVRAGDDLVVQFILTNAYPHGTIKDVKVRYFVVRVDKVGQKELPELEDNTVVEGHATLNMKPKCRVGARFGVKLDTPGVYLLRVDTVGTKSDHEHFSAIDLVVR